MTVKQNEESAAGTESVYPVIRKIQEYLESDQMRYNVVSPEALELYMQGNNLTMHLVIYLHNGHLIFRIPAFIRNVELRRQEILLFIMQITSEILDIRFEISKDGRSLSACCQHILEDGELTRKQFDLAMMVLMHIVDDTFPRFMQLVYGCGDVSAEAAGNVDEVSENSIDNSEAAAEEVEENDEFAPIPDDEDDKPRNLN